MESKQQKRITQFTILIIEYIFGNSQQIQKQQHSQHISLEYPILIQNYTKQQVIQLVRTEQRRSQPKINKNKHHPQHVLQHIYPQQPYVPYIYNYYLYTQNI